MSATAPAAGLPWWTVPDRDSLAEVIRHAMTVAVETGDPFAWPDDLADRLHRIARYDRCTTDAVLADVLVRAANLDPA